MKKQRKENKQQRNERNAQLLIIPLALIFLAWFATPSLTEWYNSFAEAKEASQFASDNDEVAVSKTVRNEIVLKAKNDVSCKNLEQLTKSETNVSLRDHKIEVTQSQQFISLKRPQNQEKSQTAKEGVEIASDDEEDKDEDEEASNQLLISEEEQAASYKYMMEVIEGKKKGKTIGKKDVEQKDVVEVTLQTTEDTNVSVSGNTVKDENVTNSVSANTTENKKVTDNSVSDKSISNNSVTEIHTTKKIHLYESPDENSEDITVRAGEVLSNVIEAGNGWLKVTYKGKEWYVYYLYTDYAEKAKKEPVAVVQYNEVKFGRVTGRSVNLRSYPGTTSKIVGGATKNEIFEVVGLYHLLKDERHGWYLLRTASGKMVFMYAEYFKIEDELTEEMIAYNVTNEDSYASNSVRTLNETVNASNIAVTEDDVLLLAQIGTKEANPNKYGMLETAMCMQVAFNRSRINNISLRAVVSAPSQYPDTWTAIKNGRVHPSAETIEMAKQIISGTRNGFDGSSAPKEMWNDGYYQAKFEQGTIRWFSGIHWFGTK